MTHRIGAQSPRILTAPAYVKNTAADDVIEMARLAGLDLDPWQQLILRDALGENDQGKWAAFEACMIVPRQNGKSALLCALILAALFVWEERLVVFSAHKFDTAQEVFGLLSQLVDEHFSDEVKRIYTANGKEAIVLKNGCRAKFVARSRGAARGFTGDRLIFDEAYDLSPSALGSMIPSLAARSMRRDSNPQVWYASSAPHADSDVLRGIRDRAQGSNPGRLFFAEWSCPEGTDPDDVAAWYAANPALGIRIAEDFIRDERAALPADEFLRERLGVVTTESASGVLPMPDWQACHDPTSNAATGFAALTVGPQMAWAALAYAGTRPDGLLHVEVVRHEAGVAWLTDACRNATTETRQPLVVDPRGPTVGVLDRLRTAGIPLREISTAEFVGGCAALQADVLERRVRHLGDPKLTGAVAGADIRPVGEAWAFSPARSSVDITPLLAITLAAIPTREAPVKVAPFFVY